MISSTLNFGEHDVRGDTPGDTQGYYKINYGAMKQHELKCDYQLQWFDTCDIEEL